MFLLSYKCFGSLFTVDRGGIFIQIIPLTLESSFAEGSVNAFLVVGDTVTLVDTGNLDGPSFEQLKRLIALEGYGLSDLDHIILTHMHTDHSGGVARIQNEVSIPVYVHEKARHVIEGGEVEFTREQSFYQDFLYRSGATINERITQSYRELNWQEIRYVKENEYIKMGGSDFTVEYVPGHSQTDLLFYNQEGVALAGDLLLPDISVNAFIEPPDPGASEKPKTLLQYRESLMKMCKLPLKTVYPGHGQVIFNHKALIEKRLAEHDKRCARILAVLEKGDATVYQLCQTIYPKLKGSAVYLGLSQIQGHLELLEVRGETICQQRNAIDIYSIRL